MYILNAFLNSRKFFLTTLGLTLSFILALKSGQVEVIKYTVVAIGTMVGGYSVGQGIVDSKNPKVPPIDPGVEK